MFTRHQQGTAERYGKVGRRVAFLLAVLIAIAISASLFFLFGRDPSSVAKLTRYGYLGAFLISLAGNASIFLFMGIVLPLLASLGAVLYPATGIVGPVLIGLLGGVGAAIGETVGYGIGYSGRGFVENRTHYEKLAKWVRRWGPAAVFVLSLAPLVFDVVAIAAGILRIPLWKFVLACWLGRSLLYTSVVVLAALGLEAVLPYLS